MKLLIILLFLGLSAHSQTLNAIAGQKTTAPSVIPGDSILVNVKNNGSAASTILNGDWNSWLPVAATPSSAFNYKNGTPSTITATYSVVTGGIDNGVGYCPTPAYGADTVWRYGVYGTGTQTLTFNGLNNAKTYDLIYIASRFNNNATTTITVGAASSTFSHYINCTLTGYLTGLIPSGGSIVVSVTSSGANKYLNGFIIVEK